MCSQNSKSKGLNMSDEPLQNINEILEQVECEEREKLSKK